MEDGGLQEAGILKTFTQFRNRVDTSVLGRDGHIVLIEYSAIQKYLARTERPKVACRS